MNYTMTPSPLKVSVAQGSIRIADLCGMETDFDLPPGISRMLPLCKARKEGKAGKDKHAGRLKLRITRKKIPVDGAYELTIGRNGVEISAAGMDGVRYGARRLEQLLRESRSAVCGAWDGKKPSTDPGTLNFQQISDSPALPVRGMHFYFPAMRHLSFAEHLALLDSMAQWNLNTVIFEYENRFPYRKHSAVSAPDAFSKKEVRKLIEHARDLGLNVIPLHQSLGHVDYILRHAAYADIREEQTHCDQWCPSNPKSFRLFKEMADEVIDLHGSEGYFHIGGDETRRLGVCPQCAERVRKDGVGKLYLDFIRQAVEYIVMRGLTPIVWDDMVCSHIEVLDELPREAVLMYWEYWTTNDPSAMFVARADRRGQVMDLRWRSAWQSELDPVERRMLDDFSQPLDLKTELSKGFLERFGKYLGAEFPKRVRAFPYLEYYRDHGFKVICAGAASANHTNWRGMPDFPRYADNLFCFGRRARESKAMGLIATTWYPMPFAAYAPGIMYAGQAAWTGGNLAAPKATKF